MNKKILITGSSGFVASHFIEYIYSEHPEYEIVCVDMGEPQFDYSKFKERIAISFYKVNLLDFDALLDVFTKTKPDYVLHLAAFSSVAYSWKFPEESFQNNCNIFLNLIHVIQKTNPQCRVLSVGSSEEYGNVKHEDLPIRENQPVVPVSPYAVARVSQEMMSKVYVDAYGMNIILTRSFNHIGPRQDNRFVVPSFINRILDLAENGEKSGSIETGNLEIVRDFVDVRDVVRAYYLLLTKGTSGEVYNICSGKGIALANIVKYIAEKIGIEVKTQLNPEFVRPCDNMEVVGSPYKIETELGWKPQRDLYETLNDMIKWYENERNK